MSVTYAARIAIQRVVRGAGDTQYTKGKENTGAVGYLGWLLQDCVSDEERRSERRTDLILSPHSSPNLNFNLHPDPTILNSNPETSNSNSNPNTSSGPDPDLWKVTLTLFLILILSLT